MASTSLSARSNNHNVASNDDSFAEAEPPPPYSTVATGDSTTLEANYSRPYEVQDSGAFSQPSHPPPSTSHNNTFQPPAGPPSAAYQHNTSPNNNAPLPPPRHPSHIQQQSTGNPQPHIDGVSSFNRPALPNQPPAHTRPPRPPAQAQRYAPTVAPSSGQPLLYKGKLLVYADGFVCPKCHNTGYKAYDPSAPHMRCWDKYGKLYTSAIQHSPNFDFSNPHLQRPLPNTRYNASLPPPAQQQQQQQQYQQQHQGYYVAGQQPPRPPIPQQGYPGQQYYHQPPQQHRPQFGVYHSYNSPVPQTVMGGPPPGALVVQPGDPRIGGFLCRECGGRGETLGGGLFFLDYQQCWTCRGTGRVF